MYFLGRSFSFVPTVQGLSYSSKEVMRKFRWKIVFKAQVIASIQ